MKFPSESVGKENEQIKLIVAGVFLRCLVIDQRALNLALIALRADIFFWKICVIGRSYSFHRAMFGLFGDTDIDIADGSKRWSCFLRQAVKVDSAMKRVIHHEDAETVFG